MRHRCLTGRPHGLGKPFLVGGDWNMTLIFLYWSSQLRNSYFSEGLNHQPDLHLCFLFHFEILQVFVASIHSTGISFVQRKSPPVQILCFNSWIFFRKLKPGSSPRFGRQTSFQPPGLFGPFYWSFPQQLQRKKNTKHHTPIQQDHRAGPTLLNRST